MKSMETKKKIVTVVIHTVLILVSITMLVPFLWMVLTAFKSVTEATSVDPFVIFVSCCLCGINSNYGRLCIRTFEF